MLSLFRRADRDQDSLSKIQLICSLVKKRSLSISLDQDEGPTSRELILHRAVQLESSETLKLFLDAFGHNLDPNKADKSKRTALIALLISRQSYGGQEKGLTPHLTLLRDQFHDTLDLNVQDDSGKSALDYAAGYDHLSDFLDVFCVRNQNNGEEFGALQLNPNIQNDYGQTILHKMQNAENINLILTKLDNIDFGLKDLDGLTCLHRFAKHSDERLLAAALPHIPDDFNLNAQYSERKETLAMFCAQESNALECFDSQMHGRYDPDILDVEGYSLPMRAVYTCTPKFFNTLLSRPSKYGISHKNDYKETLTDIVKDNPEVCREIKHLIKVKLDEETESSRSLPALVEQMNVIIDKCAIPSRDKQNLKRQVNGLGEDIANAIEGRSESSLGMSLANRAMLRANHVFLLNELEPKDGTLVDHIFQANVIDRNQMDEIRACKTRLTSAKKLLDILPYCGEDAYENFITALRATNKGYVADELEKAAAGGGDDVESSNALVPFSAGSAMGSVDIPIDIAGNQRITISVALHGTPQV